MYVNGSVLKKIRLKYYGLPPLLFDPNHPIVIGGNLKFGSISGYCCKENFNGTTGQVAVYERVLTPAQVAAHYKAGHDAHYEAG